MSRLHIDMTDLQHQSLKTMAALHGKTIKQYALDRLLTVDGDTDQAWLELQSLLHTRIRDGLAGNISSQSIGEILDEELSKVGP
jgi:hypothetical protein